MNSNLLTFIIVVMIAMLAGCSTVLKVPPYLGHQPSLPDGADLDDSTLSIQYLGVGGHLFRYGEDAIMTGPSFTNPPLLAAGPFFPLRADEEKIDRYLPPVDDVEMILIGHAHYDHLLDVPYVMRKYARYSHVYGSNTTGHIIAAEVDKSRIHALNNVMAKGETPGQWIYSKSRRIRIMAIRSSHSPHLMGIKVMKGRYKKDLGNLPWHAFGWIEGQTLAFLIDFLDVRGNIAHRVYYQDSASAPNQGLIPTSIAEEQKRVDVAIICSAAFAEEKNYPESIINNTQPRHVIVGHWEDFFGNDLSKPQRWVRFTDQEEFFRRLNNVLPDGAEWTVPEIFARYHFLPGGRLVTNSSQ